MLKPKFTQQQIWLPVTQGDGFHQFHIHDQINSFISKTREWNVSLMIPLYLCPVRLLRSWHLLRTQQRQHLRDEVGYLAKQSKTKQNNRLPISESLSISWRLSISESQTDKKHMSRVNRNNTMKDHDVPKGWIRLHARHMFPCMQRLHGGNAADGRLCPRPSPKLHAWPAWHPWGCEARHCSSATAGARLHTACQRLEQLGPNLPCATAECFSQMPYRRSSRNCTMRSADQSTDKSWRSYAKPPSAMTSCVWANCVWASCVWVSCVWASCVCE